jgi:hypothetical protein
MINKIYTCEILNDCNCSINSVLCKFCYFVVNRFKSFVFQIIRVQRNQKTIVECIKMLFQGVNFSELNYCPSPPDYSSFFPHKRAYVLILGKSRVINHYIGDDG